MTRTHATSELKAQEYDYEKITRQMRWFSIVIVLVTLPPGQPQTWPILGLAALGILYNLSRYIKPLMRRRWYSSRITMLAVDNLFVALLILFVGRPDLAYTGFLGLMILTATYWYGLRGTVIVLLGQFLALAVTATAQVFPPLQPGPIRTIFLSSMVLLLFGLLLERLTHIERLERDTLKRLSDDKHIEQERLLAVVDSLHDATMMIDSKGRIMQANGALRDLAGNEHPQGEDVSTVLPMRHQVKHSAVKWSDLLANTPQRHRDLILKGSDGNDINLDINITPVHLPLLRSTNYVVVCRDITKEKSLDEQREEFISVASHELGTPLTMIEGTLSTALLDKKTLPPLTVQLMEQAYDNAVFLVGMVRDFTTLSNAQNDAIPIQMRPVNARELLEGLMEDYRPQITTKGLTMTAEVRPGTPEVISTENHIREILINYINNALKYTSKGRVTISAGPTTSGGVLFEVTDTGIGLSEADQKRMFTKFYRAEDYHTRQTGGTGIGLYLCSELAARINGKVWCKSKLHHGSSFYLEVPPFSRLDRDHGKVVQAEVSNLLEKL